MSSHCEKCLQKMFQYLYFLHVHAESIEVLFILINYNCFVLRASKLGSSYANIKKYAIKILLKIIKI